MNPDIRKNGVDLITASANRVHPVYRRKQNKHRKRKRARKKYSSLLTLITKWKTGSILLQENKKKS